MLDRHSAPYEKVLDALFLIGFLLLAWLFVVRPLTDVDFWWHLKAGEVMVHNQALLTSDPFAFTGDGVVSLREKLILQGYWLWQLLFYSAYSVCGFSGITLLEGVTLGFLFFVLFYRMRKDQVPPAIGMLLLTVALIVFRMFFLERPQIFSFLFASILLGLFDAIRRGSRPHWLLYPLMILWANCHAGFFFGDLLLTVFSVGALWEYRNDRERLKSILLWAACGIGVSLLSPTSYSVFVNMLDQSNNVFQSGNMEFKNTLWFFRYSEKTHIVLLWSLLLLNVYALVASKKRYVPDILIFVLTAGLALTYIRMIGFYVMAVIPVLAYYLKEAEIYNKKSSQTSCKVFSIILLIYVIFCEVNYKKTKLSGNPDLNSIYIPEKISDFILTQEIQGNMYNDYGWGGYLIWRLYPQAKVFFDGRCLDTRTFIDYHALEDASRQKINGVETFRGLLQKYQIDFVVQKHFLVFGGMPPLLKYLLNDPDWIPVYLDDHGYILIRVKSDNAEIIKKFGKDRLRFLLDLIKYYDNGIAQSPNLANQYVTRADLLSYLGRYAEAEKDIAQAKALMPSQPKIAQKIRELEVLRRQSGAGR